MLHPYTKKLIAPVAVTTLMIIAYIAYMIFAIKTGFPTWVQVLVTVVALIMTGAMLYVLYTRYKEIMSGEEDDLDKY